MKAAEPFDLASVNMRPSGAATVKVRSKGLFTSPQCGDRRLLRIVNLTNRGIDGGPPQAVVGNVFYADCLGTNVCLVREVGAV